MAAMAVNPRSQASTATGQCLQRYLAATMAQTGRGILWAAIFVVNSGKFVHFFSGLNRFSM